MNYYHLLYTLYIMSSISVASADFYCGFNPPLDQTELVRTLKTKIMKQNDYILKLKTSLQHNALLISNFGSIKDQLNDLPEKKVKLNKQFNRKDNNKNKLAQTGTIYINEAKEIVNNSTMELENTIPEEKIYVTAEPEENPVKETEEERREKLNKLISKMDTLLNEPGWIVLQKRINGSLDFYRNWTEYKAGFGDPNGEYFMGLDKLYGYTSSRPHELYIQLESFEGEKRFAHYDKFQIGSAAEDYALKSLGEYSGTAGDSLHHNLNQKFSTFDHDRDSSAGNCAKQFSGAWWYSKCGFSNLNGKYLHADYDYDSDGQGIFWDEWLGYYYSLKTVLMMIRYTK